MVRVPHHDPEHGGSIFLTTLSLSMGRRVMVAVRQAHRPEEDREEDSRAARLKLSYQPSALNFLAANCLLPPVCLIS